jgi:translation initiation factor 5B
VNHKKVVAAQGVKVCGKDLEKGLAGTQVLVAQHPDEVEILKEEMIALMKEEFKSIKLSEKGVYVQASTLGSLEALLEFLKTSKIPVKMCFSVVFLNDYNSFVCDSILV